MLKKTVNKVAEFTYKTYRVVLENQQLNQFIEYVSLLTTVDSTNNAVL